MFKCIKNKKICVQKVSDSALSLLATVPNVSDIVSKILRDQIRVLSTSVFISANDSLVSV
jgi:hypothetical protein